MQRRPVERCYSFAAERQFMTFARLLRPIMLGR